jgi:hypothetical protein
MDQSSLIKIPEIPATSFVAGRSALLQRKGDRAPARSPTLEEASPLVHKRCDPAARAFMEPRFGYDFSRVRVQADSQTAKIQRTRASAGRLSIGAPGGRCEQEAEQVAERVLRMPEPAAGVRQGTQQAVPSQIGLHGGGDGKRVQRDMGMVQAQEQPGHTPQLTRGFENRMGALQGGGQPLAEPIRASMEARFGHDFSRVHIHTDQTASGLAASINARAFTLGRDVVFGAGQYAPGSEAGQRLLAHELTHVVQQRAGTPYVARACDPATTHVNDAPAIIAQARVDAIQFVNAAIPMVVNGLRAAPDSWEGMIARGFLDRHFHCPTREHLEYILTTLQEIGARLPTVSLDCLRNDHECGSTPQTHGSHFARSSDNTAGRLCPGFFHDPQPARAGTLVTLAAELLQRPFHCNRHASCYNDFTRIGSGLMMNNAYSYGYFSSAAGGHEVVPEPPGGVTCRPPEPSQSLEPQPAAEQASCVSQGTHTGRWIVIPPPPAPAHVLSGTRGANGEIQDERIDRQRRLFVCDNHGERINQSW